MSNTLNIDYYTPEEAAFKVCPFMSNSEYTNCAGNNCMKWRWKTREVYRVGGALSSGFPQIPEVSRDPEGRGYCEA